MSFSTSVKTEIMKNVPETRCCAAAMLYGLLLGGRSFSAASIELVSEKKAVVQFAKGLTRRIFGEMMRTYSIERQNAAGHSLYSFRIVDPDDIQQILLFYGHAGQEVSLRIQRQCFVCTECRRHFLAGAFLSMGRVTNPQKEYHLELTSSRRGLMEDLAEEFRRIGWQPKASRRGNVNLLYFKDSKEIEEVLVAVGAPMKSLEVMNVKIYKDIRNQVNRLTNCETANIDKTATAAAGQTADIEYILEKRGADFLGEDLLLAARLRLENPEASLNQLMEVCPPGISRSSLNRRLAKIRELAKKLREEEGSNGQ
ncbi:DNA-binding protein WhiA [Acetanaerobacterium sp. MSJ-12]|uniref:DNA-binding protein WhiA n=1 Tax=Acetanaerobacterium sp. MSJ-12 TaxID=2841535 RepID=UPI001C0EE2E7|nr:DNA-binding protein WhiA [Acetanaerobacterium sp. MSJ-12]MBU5419382.1 DNA-binding protein WhiA [Acetanaerobacterium sp. MSJ-12]